MKKSEKITIAVSVVALLVSLGTLAFSVWQFRATYTSHLKVFLDPEFYSGTDKILVFHKTDRPTYPAAYDHKLNMTIANVGNIRTSIRAITVWPVVPSDADRRVGSNKRLRRGNLIRTNDSAKVIRIQQKGQERQIRLPLTIEPRGVTELVLTMRCGIPAAVWNDVNDQITVGEAVNASKIRRVWNNAGFNFPGHNHRNENLRQSANWVYYWVRVEKEDGTLVEGDFDLNGTVWMRAID